MRIQWKFFILLLAVGVLPLALVATVSLNATGRFGRAASQEMARELEEMVAAQVRRDAASASAAVARGAGAARAAARALALEAEARLAQGLTDLPRVWYSEDYDTPGREPGGMERPGRYARPGEGGAMAVNFGQLVFATAPGVDRRDVRGQAARLSRILPAAQALFRDLEGSAYRLHVTLETGLTAAYPGFGGYPEGFDPRRAGWYRRARGAEGPVWSELLVSRSTGLALFSFSAPLRGPGGGFAGVASVELPLSWFLQEAELASSWTDRARSFIVGASQAGGGGREGLRVVAGEDYRDNAAGLVGGTYADLEPENEGRAFRSVVEGVRAGKPGAARLPFSGEDCIWSYAPLGVEGLAFLLVVPAEVAGRAPQELRALVDDGLAVQWFVTYVAAVGVALAAVLAAWFTSRRGTAATRAMTRAWARLGAGDFDVRLDLATGDERDELVRAFNDTVPKLAERLRLKESVSLAREVQQGLLPASLPTAPGLELAGATRYCDAAGGDFYDALRTGPGGALLVAVGDVSGHDVASALLMASTRAYLRSVGRSARPLAERVAALNRLVTADTADSGRFVTLFCLECDPGGGELAWVRAGHEPALAYDPATGRAEPLDGAGAALGFSASTVCAEGRRRFARPGELVVLCTDGVFEARAPSGEPFGRERLLGVLRSAGEGGAQSVLDAVFRALDEHRGGQPPEDDVTVVVVRRTAQ
ncbi:MAG: SpoIIE family protein phosphatase [Desulfovibrionaceae bacterium]